MKQEKVVFLLELAKLKLLLKKYKNVFSDILDDMSIKMMERNTIHFIDYNGNEMSAIINDSEITFIRNDKRFTKVTIPKEKEDTTIQVVDIIKEERPKGCIIEVIDKLYSFIEGASDKDVLVDFISKRYVFDRDININRNMELENTCKMKTIFEVHLKTLVKPKNEIRYYANFPYTIVLINGNDISYLYNTVNGIDRIYDLYNGTINERNGEDIFAIHLGLLSKQAFGYKEINGITGKEDTICGSKKHQVSSSEEAFINNFIRDKIGYSKPFDIYDIHSVITAITYQKTQSERTQELIEKKLGISYEEFNHLDYNEQVEMIQRMKPKNQKKDKKCAIVKIGSGEHSIFIRVKNGQKIMTSDGTMIEVGLTPEEAKRKFEEHIDERLYSRPVVLIKKIARNIKSKFQ